MCLMSGRDKEVPSSRSGSYGVGSYFHRAIERDPNLRLPKHAPPIRNACSQLVVDGDPLAIQPRGGVPREV